MNEKHGASEAQVQYADDLVVPELEKSTERKLMSKIDWHVLPYLCILYLLAFLDRVNISNAYTLGLAEPISQGGLDLQQGTKYNTALVIFFVPYILFEIPSNIFLKRLKPHLWLSACMFVFGVTMIGQGLVSSYGGLLTARFFLGVAETGMFPGCFYLIGMWYQRAEAQKRYSFFFSSTSLAGAFGGLLAAAIGKMSGLRGYLGWRWVFILEGVLTCLVAISFFFLLPGFPEDAKWLTSAERAYVKSRLQADQGHNAVERKITFRDVGSLFKDYKVILGGFMYFGLIVPAYAYAYFSPSILRGFKYSPIQTQLHSVPPWAAAFVLSMILAWASDRTRHRYLFTLIPTCISIAGFIILRTVHHNIHVQYAAMFFVAMGTYAAMPVCVCWFTMNLGGHHRRAIGTAWQVGFGNIGGIIAVFAFVQKDAPRFTTGYSIGIAFACISALSCALYLVACIGQNRKKDRMPQQLGGMTVAEKAEMGDLSPDYRYQL